MADHSRLLLFTGDFPRGRGETFLEPELPFLAAGFDRVTVFPASLPAGRRPVPANVEVDISLGEALRDVSPSNHRWNRKARAVVRQLAYHPRLACLAAMRGVTAPRQCHRAMATAARISVIADWFAKKCREWEALTTPCLVYCYWTTYLICGLRLGAAELGIRLPIVSRAHGYDLYEEIRGDEDWPFRRETIGSVDHVFCISEHGLQYLLARHPRLQGRASLSRLGVVDVPGSPDPPDTNEVRFCSCSLLRPVKRVDRIIEGLAMVARSHPDQRIRWDHLGEGGLMAELRALAGRILPGSVEYRFWGSLDNRAVREFYQKHPVDAFLNVSVSEGVPVSIMEAQCAGIPVIATAVGGTPELVNDENGRLLGTDPTAAEVAEAMGYVIVNRSDWAARRALSRRQWEFLSNAHSNFPQFVRQLQDVVGLGAAAVGDSG